MYETNSVKRCLLPGRREGPEPALFLTLPPQMADGGQLRILEPFDAAESF
jgi:hypothetical protein